MGPWQGSGWSTSGGFLGLRAGPELGRTREKQAAWYCILLKPENSELSYNVKWGGVWRLDGEN